MKDPALIAFLSSLLLFLVAHFTGVLSAYAATNGKEPDRYFYAAAVGFPLIASVFFGPILYTLIT